MFTLLSAQNKQIWKIWHILAWKFKASNETFFDIFNYCESCLSSKTIFRLLLGLTPSFHLHWNVPSFLAKFLCLPNQPIRQIFEEDGIDLLRRFSVKWSRFVYLFHSFPIRLLHSVLKKHPKVSSFFNIASESSNYTLNFRAKNQHEITNLKNLDKSLDYYETFWGSFSNTVSIVISRILKRRRFFTVLLKILQVCREARSHWGKTYFFVH